MTALAGYERLECEGRYWAGPDAPAQSVLVKFGDASLMIMTFGEEPITHWPLASLSTAGGPGPAAMRLRPDDAAPDRLEIDDPAMVAAIGEVCRSLRSAPVRPRLSRRWRWPLRLVVLAGLLAAGSAAIPPALDRFAEMLPEPGRARLGDAALRMLAGDRLCDDPAARAALGELARRVSPAGGPAVGLLVADLPDGAPAAIGAPGSQVLIARGAIAMADGPGALADAVALALAEARAARHTAYALRRAGIGGLPAALSGRLDSRALVEAAVAGLTRVRPVGTAVLDDAAALRAAMPLDRMARPLGSAEWRTIRAICAR